MKALLSVLVLFLSAKTMAHTCQISLYDAYNRPILYFNSTYDNNCQAAANSCYKAIQQYNFNPNYFKCYTISMTNDPLPQGKPTPTQLPPKPVSTPNPDAIDPTDLEYIRDIESGETVIYKDKYYVVTGVENSLYSLKPQEGKKSDILKEINRQDISITRGCLRDICTKTAVISRSAQSMMAVEGISANGTYILKNTLEKTLASNTKVTDLIKTKGCAEDVYGKVCVGDTIQGRNNDYFEVAGIQSETTVVLKDSKQKLYFDVSARSLIVVR